MVWEAYDLGVKQVFIMQRHLDQTTTTTTDDYSHDKDDSTRRRTTTQSVRNTGSVFIVEISKLLTFSLFYFVSKIKLSSRWGLWASVYVGGCLGD